MPTTKNNKIIQFDISCDMYFSRGLDKQEKGEFPDALSCYYNALALDETNSEIIMAIAETLSQMQRYDESNTLLHLLFRKGELVDECLYGLGYNYFALSENEAAAYCLNGYLEMTNGEGEYTADAIEALSAMRATISESKHTPKPLREVSASEIVAPIKYEAFLNLQHREYESAVANFERAVKLAPMEQDLKTNLAVAYVCAKKYDLGEKLLRERLMKHPNDVKLNGLLVVVMKDTGRENEALALADKLQIDPEQNLNDIENVIKLYWEVGLDEKAYAYAKRTVRLYKPYDLAANHCLAQCAVKLKKFSEAEACYALLVRIDPTDIIAKFLLNYVRSLSDSSENIITALEYNFHPCEFITRWGEIRIALQSGTEAFLDSWKENEFRLLIKWGLKSLLDVERCKIIAQLGAIKDDEALELLRDCLIERNLSMEVKEAAASELIKTFSEDRLIIFANGQLIDAAPLATLNTGMKIPRAYVMLLPGVLEIMMPLYGSAETVKIASRIWRTFINKQNGEYKKLTQEQANSLMAAIEYATLVEVGTPVDMKALFERYGITLKRFQNAYKKISESEET